MSSYKDLYWKRKENGLCVQCGKEKENKSLIMCEDCRIKKREYDKDLREKRKLLGFCPACGKNKLFGDEKNCIECRCNKSLYKHEYYLKNKEKDIERVLEYKRKKREQRKKDGICCVCGKESTKDSPYVTCYSCREKRKIEYKLRTENRPDKRSERTKKGLCYFCGEKVKKGFGVCEKHHKMYEKRDMKNNKWRNFKIAYNS